MTGRLARGALFGPAKGGGILIKSPAELALMREAGRVVAQVLARMRALVRPGATTAELDRAADELIRAAGAIASFKGYPNARPGGPAYPAATCISVNDELVHGIPSPRRLQAGDIVSIDVGAIVKGWHGDGAWTFPVGEIGAEAGRRRSLWSPGSPRRALGIVRATSPRRSRRSWKRPASAWCGSTRATGWGGSSTKRRRW